MLSREILEGNLPPLHRLSYTCDCAYTERSLPQDLLMKWVLYIVFVSCRVVSTLCSTNMYVSCYWHFFIPVPMTMATLLYWYKYSGSTRVVALSG